jgi:type IV pilus assembly protein PilN
MIRINLLGVERTKIRKSAAFDIGQQLTLLCSLILVAAALGIGWWYWTLNEQATRVEADIAAAQGEQARLASLLIEVTQFEAQRAQLQQRVRLIEELRAGQSIPVQLLDHVSRSIPDMLWLTDLDQTGDALTIQGRTLALPAVSRLVGNLGDSDLLLKPIDIVDTKVEAAQTGAAGGVDLISFTVRANIKKPEAPKPAVAAPPAVPAPGGRAGG